MAGQDLTEGADAFERWAGAGDDEFVVRIYAAAQSRGGTVATLADVLTAIRYPPERTIAGEVLQDFGIDTPASVPLNPDGAAIQGMAPSVARLLGMAQGLALATGSRAIHDHHFLLAFIYTPHVGASLITSVGELDPSAMVNVLQDRGIEVPSAGPPPPASRPTIAVYVEDRLWRSALSAAAATGGVVLAHGPSRARPGQHWMTVDSDEIVHAVRNAMNVADAVESMPFLEAMRIEAEPMP